MFLSLHCAAVGTMYVFKTFIIIILHFLLTVYRKLLLFNLCESWIVKDLVLDVVGVHTCFDTLI